MSGDSAMCRHLRVFFFTVLITLSSSYASAAILEATFKGTYAGGVAGTFSGLGYDSIPYSTLIGNPFTATIVVDTSLGTLVTLSPGHYDLLGGLVTASLFVESAYPFGVNIPGGFLFGAGPELAWLSSGFNSFVPTFFGANTGGLQSLVLGVDLSTFQNGPCPGRPCGLLNLASATMIDISPVPGPAVGAGLPGLLMAIAGFIGWRRRRFFLDSKEWKH